MRIAKKASIKQSVEPIAECSYESAIDCIKSAIDKLAECGSEDERAMEAIANLSVILFDLQ